MGSPEVLVTFCTAPKPEIGAKLARGLLAARLAACVNVLPEVRSFYRWEGDIQDESEVLLVIKTTRDRFEAMRSWLEEHHPYDVPEILGMPVTSGNLPYLRWVAGETAED